MVTGVPQELETICLKSDPRKRNDTAHFLSDISYTRFCIHFVLFSPPAVSGFRAAGTYICIRWPCTEKNVTTGVKENSDSNGGGRLRHWHCSNDCTVCLSICHYLIINSSAQAAQVQSQSKARTPHILTFTLSSISLRSFQVWQTGTYPSCLFA